LGRTSLILAVLVIAAGLCGPALALDDIHWLDPDADRAAALTTAPAECLAMPADPEQAWRVALGRVAFHSPVLLGGLAARSGMSCDTCHQNGHGNEAFFIAGVSGPPGTADVTSALFSQTRGDDILNPVPIPDLTDAGGKARFGTMRPATDLHSFVHSVAVDEFQGKEPIPVVADGLVAYVAALKTSACPATASIALTVQGAADDMARTYEVLLAALDQDDRRAADFVLLSLNASLGRLAQRFPDTDESARTLPALGHDLNAIRPLIQGDRRAARLALAAWRARLDSLLQALALRTDSLFALDNVRRWLGTQKVSD
jgi:hypothetical protein